MTITQAQAVAPLEADITNKETHSACSVVIGSKRMARNAGI